MPQASSHEFLIGKIILRRDKMKIQTLKLITVYVDSTLDTRTSHLLRNFKIITDFDDEINFKARSFLILFKSLMQGRPAPPHLNIAQY